MLGETRENSKLLMPMGFQKLFHWQCKVAFTPSNGTSQPRGVASRENPIGEFLGVTGPRNGVAGIAATASIPRGSDRDGGGVHRW